MDLWKNKVVPKFKLLLGGKKAAAEASKSFDESKGEISKELEEKKDELRPKVMGIYEASSTELKALIKEPNVAGLKKHSAKVHKFLEDLVTIDFPGSKAVSDATNKYGPVLVSGPVTFVFEKVSTFIVTPEEPTTITTREVEIPPPAETTEAPPVTTTTAAAATTTTIVVQAKETVVEKAAKVEAGKPEEAPKAK